MCDFYQWTLSETACTTPCTAGSEGVPDSAQKSPKFSKTQKAGWGAQPLAIFAISPLFGPLYAPVVISCRRGCFGAIPFWLELQEVLEKRSTSDLGPKMRQK